MRKAIGRIDRIILLCRNVERTAGIYSQALGLKVQLQSPEFVELRDSANMAICLQKATQAAHLNKGYSPIISLRVAEASHRSRALMTFTLGCCVVNCYLMERWSQLPKEN